MNHFSWRGRERRGRRRVQTAEVRIEEDRRRGGGGKERRGGGGRRKGRGNRGGGMRGERERCRGSKEDAYGKGRIGEAGG